MMCFKEKITDEMRKYYIEDSSKCETSYSDVVKNYIEYYHSRALMSKGIYYIMNTIKIVAVASIPILQVCNMANVSSIGITVASAVGVIMEGLMALSRVHQKWHLYRSTNNSLLREQRKFATGTGKYDCPNDKKLSLYVESIEYILGEEAKKWSESIKGLAENKTDSINEQEEGA